MEMRFDDKNKIKYTLKTYNNILGESEIRLYFKTGGYHYMELHCLNMINYIYKSKYKPNQDYLFYIPMDSDNINEEIKNLLFQNCNHQILFKNNLIFIEFALLPNFNKDIKPCLFLYGLNFEVRCLCKKKIDELNKETTQLREEILNLNMTTKNLNKIICENELQKQNSKFKEYIFLIYFI